MNVSFHPPLAREGRERRGAFALVVTLLILSLLVVVAVSYLSSMVSERQTADAYSAKARAEQAAQAGADSAMAILTQSFRDFPDSATVWDPQQSENGSPTSANTRYNEGTSLYLRAVDAGNGTAKPLPKGLAAPGETPVPANDPGGNNPNNPAGKNFVLPLISGVPSGQARLASNKSAIFPAKMGVDTSASTQGTPNAIDPAQQNYTDLNIRRFAGDIQGVIGAPPDWAETVPKPARAYWVNLKDNTGHKTGRYAFWIEDESFRTNVNYLGLTDSSSTPLRADNSADGKSVVDPVTQRARSVLPSDMFFSGALAGFPTVFTPTDNAQSVLTTRSQYPGNFLPDPLAFMHVSNGGASTFPTKVADGLRYLTTTQSGTLNLTRHGTQRLDLNAKTTIDPGSPVTMTEIRKLVEAIRFHLPNFGQRFYRTNNSVTGPVLNKPDDVKADTVTGFNNADIYLYKTAANLRDYIDADDQPTLIVRPHDGLTTPSLWNPGTVIYHPFGGDGAGGNGPNYLWAQGKDGAPFLQEAMVRYRPAIQSSGANYTLAVDYYVEFWNMSDHDVTAAQLGNPYVRISNQQTWWSAYIPAGSNGKPIISAAPTRVAPLTVPPSDSGVAPGVEGLPRDFNMDLISGVYRADNPTVPVPTTTGVVFKAGTATVITSDPDFVAYTSGGVTHSSPVTNSVYAYGGQPLGSNGFVTTNVYYCSNTAQGAPPGQGAARRTFTGDTGLVYRPGYLRGIMPHFNPLENAGSTYLDFVVEVTLANNLGYLDCATGAFCIAAGSGDGGSSSTNGYDFTWTPGGDPHNDYLHGGTLGGNGNTPSQLGDPRANNEQNYIRLFEGSNFPAEPNQYRYGSPGKTLAPPFSLGSPNSQYVKPASTATGYTMWGDHYDWATTAYPVANPTATTAPAVIANSPLTSIGQLGDIFDPARAVGTVGTLTNVAYSRGGGRTLKIGQRDDRYWYDPSSNTVSNNVPGNNAADNVPNCNGWASWRLTDVFGINSALELPARININGVNRDGGAALRAALTGFKFQPTTTVDPLIHGGEKLANTALKTLPTDATGVSKLVSAIKTRLALTTASNNTPYGPFFERGELGELENSGGVALFGKNVPSTFSVSQELAGAPVDLNHTSDRGREELFRRLVELTCTRGDTFTVYVVGQSLSQTDTSKVAKITGTHRMRVTFRLVPKQYKDLAHTAVKDFHPGTKDTLDGSLGDPSDFDPTTTTGTDGLNTRFAKPDLYDVQVLEVNTL